MGFILITPLVVQLILPPRKEVAKEAPLQETHTAFPHPQPHLPLEEAEEEHHPPQRAS